MDVNLLHILSIIVVVAAIFNFPVRITGCFGGGRDSWSSLFVSWILSFVASLLFIVITLAAINVVLCGVINIIAWGLKS